MPLGVSNIQSNTEKNDELLYILKKMSEGSIDYSEVIENLTHIYKDGFRHSYSKIAKLLHDMEIDERDIVSESMKELVRKLIDYEKEIDDDKKEDSDVINGIIKLQDHIDLEIIRIQLDTEADHKLKDSIVKVENVDKKTQKVQNLVEKLNDETLEIERKLDSNSTQSITILSIFAGLVFVFTGGFSLITSALQNIHDANIYKLTFVLLLVGMFIFNLVFLFFYMVAKLSGRNISAHCSKTNSCECGYYEECEKCKTKNKLFRKFWFVVLPNMFFILSMLTVVFVVGVDKGIVQSVWHNIVSNVQNIALLFNR